MASRHQRKLRKHIYIGYLLALVVFTAWIGASSLAGHWTAEQPVISR